MADLQCEVDDPAGVVGCRYGTQAKFVPAIKTRPAWDYSGTGKAAFRDYFAGGGGFGVPVVSYAPRPILWLSDSLRIMLALKLI
jgi:hypothetical protein